MAENEKLSAEPRVKKIEIIVVAALVLVSLVWVLLSVLLRAPGAYAVIAVDGVEVARYSLDDDGVYEVGSHKNVVVIENGEVYMREADCPDATCVKTGRVRYAGQTIVCLPNRVSVTVIGEGGVDLET